jgi:Pregnancy-associated plasma protein-A
MTLKTTVVAGLCVSVILGAGCAGGGIETTVAGGLAPCATPNVSVATQAKLASRAPARGLPPAGPINVYVHVINKGISVPDGNVPSDWVYEQIDVLNATYGEHGYSFSLAALTLTTNPDWFNMTQGSPEEAAAKAALKQGTGQDLNIYIANLNGAQTGWASYPWNLAANPADDGVVLYFNTLPGGGAEGYNLGDNAVHEVGHWLGLYHTFENGCAKKFKGDQVRDTAYEADGAVGCPVGRDSCNNGGIDPIDNFMDTSDDLCRTNFTLGQKERMDEMWTDFRVGN